MKQKLFLKWICFSAVLLLLIPSFSSSAFSAAEGSDVSSFDEISFWCYSGTDSFEKESMMTVMIQDHEVELNNAECKPLQNLDDPISLSRIGSLSGPMSSPWPMKCHDNRHTGLSPYSTSDNNGAELWNFRADGWIGGGPIIDDRGIIYFGDEHGYFYALYSDGSLKWEFHAGIITGTPALGSDGTIYVGSWNQHLYALSSSNGSVIWKYDARDDIASSPAVAEDGTIYFGTMGFPDGQGCKIFALNPDGSKKWDYPTGYKITSDPAIGDDGTIYIGSGDTYLYALNSDGTLRWRFKTGHYIKGPPSIDMDGTIYVGSYDDYLYALNPDGSVKWQSKVGYGIETNPSIGPDGTIYVGGSRLWAINPVDGSKRWSFDPGDDQIIFQSSPAVSADGSIYFGTNIGETDGGDIVALNVDGTLRWRHRISTSGWVDSSPCIDENGVIYIGSSCQEVQGTVENYGILYAFGHGEEVNEPPNTPSISGTNSGKADETYTYTISGIDPDNDMISYFVDWDDGSDSGWQGPYSSGTSIELSHSWSEKDSYIIKAKAMDSEGSESNWATLQVSMPKNKDVFDSLLARFFHAYPWLFSLIEHLL